LGAATLVMVSSTFAANEVFRNTHVDFAVLNINSGFESSFGFAAVLRAARVPFIFAASYGKQRSAQDQHIGELTVSKPYDRD
jgi:hypothetical protein